MAFLFDPLFQAVDANGLPLAGATLTFYRAGTSTKISIYQNSQATTPHANPVTADAAGKFAAIFLATAENYKFILIDSQGATIQTVDGVPPGDGLDPQTLAAAVEEARESADVATGAMSTLLDPQFATVATAAAWTPVSAPAFIRTAYYDADQVPGSGALYKNVGASEPSHAAKFSITLSPSATVVWFEIDVAVIDVSMIGGKPGAGGNQGPLFNSVQAIGDFLSASGEYQIDTTWDLQAGKHWDCRTLILTHTLDGMDVVRADEVDDWVIRGDLKIQGKFSPALPYASHAAMLADLATIPNEGTVGFRITHSKGWRLEGLTVEGIEGDGLLIDGVTVAGEVRGDRGVVVGPQLRYNYRGLATPPERYRR